ncbi:SprT-like domain-containing protein [Cytobacillus kochii]|uniref:SprT-like domain-containing protein n=1 Tax=Cytobacillus kochii TaxID=859143 RepID=UPI001CD2BBCF|nr:SprT-like domain-containing protein [Cytobacillus kochii]MCA1025717.1 SprT-like domain-containing protein [Cytobacillus kochii]
MIVEELTDYAQNFLEEKYGMSLDIPIVINKRLRSTLGSFILTKDKPHEIEMAGFLIEYGADDVIYDTLRHELIHYALFMQGRQYRDGTLEFENELRKHNVGSTKTVFVGKVYKFICEACLGEYESLKKSIVTSPKKYRTKCCKANIVPRGEVAYNGLE